MLRESNFTLVVGVAAFVEEGGVLVIMGKRIGAARLVGEVGV